MKGLQGYQQLIEAGRVIHLNGDVDEQMIDDWRHQRRRVLKTHGKGEFAISLNTDGGSVADGLIIHHEIRLFAAQPKRKVWLVCQGEICSMGVYIAMAIKRPLRTAFPHTGFYCHLGTTASRMKSIDTGLDPEDPVVKYSEMEEEAAAHWDNHLDAILKCILVQESLLASEEVEDLMLHPRFIIDREAVEVGFISHVLN